MKHWRLTKNDGEDIGFADACLIFDAVSWDEFREWLYFLIGELDEVPTYFFDLLDMKDRTECLCHSHESMGFSGGTNLTKGEFSALTGIAYKRGFYDTPIDYDPVITRRGAMKALARSPHIEERFRETFPFIDY